MVSCVQDILLQVGRMDLRSKWCVSTHPTRYKKALDDTEQMLAKLK
jgi:hypothetical protein